MSEEYVEIASPRSSGAVRLEGKLHLPGGGGEAPGVVLCHPHPAGGGEMGVPLIRYLAEELSARGFIALRFNFAGVGMSEGSFTNGAEEPADVKAAREFLAAEGGADPASISVAGWSFGAWMSIAALSAGLEASACVAVAPPLMACDWEREAGLLASSPARRLYLAGDRDQFCPRETIERFTAAVSPRDRDKLVLLPGADHFLFGFEREVVRLAADFLSA